MPRVWPGCAAALVLSLFHFVSPPIHADIYRYVDEEGVAHFTNIEMGGRYKLFIRTPKKSPAAYIKEYEGIILQASKRFGIDPHLIEAMIRAESGFDHRAVSSKGAQGLMQLTPETANDMEVRNPFDPQENIFGGTQYFSLLLKRFDNDISLALAAYNAGPEMVEAYEGIPPIPETRAYVKRVLNYYQQYNPRAK